MRLRLPVQAPACHRRPATAVIAAASVALAAIAYVTLANPGVAHATPPAPTIDLANPTASVHDPVGQLTPVNTECAAGQVDLNLATAAELGTALTVPSDPTVNR